MFEFTIPGPPVPWKAHRGFGRKSFNPLYKERNYYQWCIAEQLKGDRPLITLPVYLAFVFYFQIPNSYSEKKKNKILENRIRPITRPDISNCVKFCEDCLKGIVIKDDAQVVCIEASKYYSLDPKTIVKVALAGLNHFQV